MARLNISERQTGDVTILDMNGDITFGEGNVEVRRCIRRLIGEGKNKIVLNLADVRYVDSSGIGEMISGLTAVSRADGTLKLLNPTPRLKDLLIITKLLTVFETCKNEREAVGGSDGSATA